MSVLLALAAMSGRPFAANNPSARRQQPALLQEHPSWSWPDATPDSRSLPGRQEAIEHLTLPPMHSHDDPDSDFDTPTATPAPFAPQPTRSNFLAQVLNGGDDGAATQRSAAVSSSRHRPAQSPPSHYNPRIPSPRNHGYVDLTREQTPPISQERSTLRTLHYSQQPTAESPSNTSSTSPDSAMLRSGRRKRDATSPLFVPLDPSSKRAKRNDGSSGTTGGRRGSRQEGANTDGPSNAAARSEVEEIERIDLIDDDTPLAEALQKQRAEQVKAQQESQNGADAPTTLTNITCVICMDVPKDLTATACGKPPHTSPHALCPGLPQYSLLPPTHGAMAPSGNHRLSLINDHRAGFAAAVPHHLGLTPPSMSLMPSLSPSQVTSSATAVSWRPS
ncbi:hypothetical protein SLS55_010512 [Diplodia seriata]|uniref:Uncharacterized protein n=1 Tax=Diplodia seriata TaxID=420778 RepID=A0ABR3BXF2_9PEZI